MSIGKDYYHKQTKNEISKIMEKTYDRQPVYEEFTEKYENLIKKYGYKNRLCDIDSDDEFDSYDSHDCEYNEKKYTDEKDSAIVSDIGTNKFPEIDIVGKKISGKKSQVRKVSGMRIKNGKNKKKGKKKDKQISDSFSGASCVDDDGYCKDCGKKHYTGTDKYGKKSSIIDRKIDVSDKGVNVKYKINYKNEYDEKKDENDNGSNKFEEENFIGMYTFDADNKKLVNILYGNEKDIDKRKMEMIEEEYKEKGYNSTLEISINGDCVSEFLSSIGKICLQDK